MLIQVLETALHLLLVMHVDVMFAKISDSSVAGLFMMKAVYIVTVCPILYYAVPQASCTHVC